MAAKNKKQQQKKTQKTVVKKASAKKVAPRVSVSAVTALMTPLDDRLLVAPEVASEKTAGGLIIPGTVDSRPSRGTVLAAGRGRRSKKGTLRPLAVNVGDEVLFAEFAGTKIQLAGNDFLILREEDLLGIVG